MKLATQEVTSPDKLAAAFEHSITWEDDVWQADPVDVPEVHDKGTQKVPTICWTTSPVRNRAASQVPHPAVPRPVREQERPISFGRFAQVPIAKAKPTSGYAQMTPDISNYADYFLRRLINSLEKPYDP